MKVTWLIPSWHQTSRRHHCTGSCSSGQLESNRPC